MIEPDDLYLRKSLDPGEDIHVDDRDQNAATNDRHTTECLHGGVHELEGWWVKQLPIPVHARNRLDRHRIRNRVLHHVPDRPK